MKKLYLLTDSFPYGTGESTFVIPELKYLLKKFEITIISSATSDCERKINISNEKIYRFHGGKLNVIDKVIHILPFLLNSESRKEIALILKEKKNIAAKLTDSYIFFIYARKYMKFFENTFAFNQDEDMIVYSFWETYRVLAMVWLKKKYKGLKLVTRVHGYDLYNERMERGGRQPYKRIMDNQIDKVVFVSQHGMQYYLSHFTENGCEEKYLISRLGVQKRYEFENVKMPENFLLVSCSNVIPLKRVDLIVKALAKICSLNVKWVHFGDGSEMKKIRELSENLLGTKQNIQYELKGAIENEKIMEFYAKHRPTCFITTSSSEGSPVSIQEALSLGIPVIGTDVGGIHEMINGNGILLSANPSVEEVYHAISAFAAVNEDEYMQMAQKSYFIWERDYNADQNAQLFADIIDAI